VNKKHSKTTENVRSVQFTHAYCVKMYRTGRCKSSWPF